MPDFQQFAAKCQRAAVCAPRDTQHYLIGEERLSFEFQEMFRHAERHARLLQQIWEWANSPTPNPLHESTRDADALDQQMGEMIGTDAAKAHARSLLVGQQEVK